MTTDESAGRDSGTPLGDSDNPPPAISRLLPTASADVGAQHDDDETSLEVNAWKRFFEKPTPTEKCDNETMTQETDRYQYAVCASNHGSSPAHEARLTEWVLDLLDCHPLQDLSVCRIAPDSAAKIHISIHICGSPDAWLACHLAQLHRLDRHVNELVIYWPPNLEEWAGLLSDTDIRVRIITRQMIRERFLTELDTPNDHN